MAANLAMLVLMGVLLVVTAGGQDFCHCWGSVAINISSLHFLLSTVLVEEKQMVNLCSVAREIK